MTHWRDYQEERKNLYAEHLGGQDRVLRISRVDVGHVKDQKGREARKPFVWFDGVEKPLAANITNCKTIAKVLNSANVEDWIGKWVTLYPTTTTKDGETFECIRVRPKAPVPPKDGKGGAAEVRDVPIADVIAAIDACASVDDLDAWWSTSAPRQGAMSEADDATMTAAFKARKRLLKAGQ